jgi:cell shape-determining protein MreD
MTGWTRRFGVLVGLMVFAHFGIRLGLGFGTEAPDLLTVAALLSARRLPAAGAAALGAGLGLLNDAFSIGAFGTTALVLGLVCVLGALSRQFVEGTTVPFHAAYLLGGVTLAEVLRLTLHAGRLAPLLPETLAAAALSAVYATIAGLIVLTAFHGAGGRRA